MAAPPQRAPGAIGDLPSITPPVGPGIDEREAEAGRHMEILIHGSVACIRTTGLIGMERGGGGGGGGEINF